MPQLKPFDAGDIGLRPSEIGVESKAAAGRRVGSAFSQISDSLNQTGARFGQAIREAGDAVVNYAAHQEISHGSAALAGMVSGLTDQWNTISKSADPNDPTTGKAFLANNLEPALQNFQGGFLTEAGQNWAQAHVNEFRQHMFQKTTADMSAAAGQAVAINQEKLINGLSNTVHGDPSSLDFALKTVEDATGSLVDSSPNLTGVDAQTHKAALVQKGKELITKSAAIGYIEKTGQIPPWASDPKYAQYINGAELKTFEGYAKAQQRSAQLQEKQLQLYQKQQATDNAHVDLSKTFTDNVSFDDNGRATIKPGYFKAIMDTEQKYPGAATERVKAMINWGQSEQRDRRETIITDPDTRTSLLSGLFNTDKPTSDVDILTAAANHKIDAHDTSVLLNLQKSLDETPLKGPVYRDVMAAARGALGADEKGHEAFGKFAYQFIPDYIRQSRAGTLPPDALDLNNPNSLISKAMAPFKRTPQQMMMDRATGGIDFGTRQAPAPTEMPKITSQSEYDKLASGATYIGTDGKPYRKP